MRHSTVLAPTGRKAPVGSGLSRGGTVSSTVMWSKLYERSRRDLNMLSKAISIPCVVNAVGVASKGIPLRKPQFNFVGLSAVVARLALFGEHTFALQLATFGGVSPDAVP